MALDTLQKRPQQMRFRHREIDLLAGLVIGFALGMGIGHEMRTGFFEKMPPGTQGDWVGGIGAFAAAIVATWLGLRAERREFESRTGQSGTYAYRIQHELTKALAGWRLLEDFLKRFGFDRLSSDAETDGIFIRAGESMKLPWLEASLGQLSLLPSDLARSVLDVAHRVAYVGGRLVRVPGCESHIRIYVVDGVLSEARELGATLDTVLKRLKQFEEETLAAE